MVDRNKWLQELEYLPECMRDFHEAKTLFKTMHHKFRDDGADDMPNWREGHCYTIDWFLNFMAQHGYTLQRCRKKGIEFYDIEETKEDYYNESRSNSASILNGLLGDKK